MKTLVVSTLFAFGVLLLLNGCGEGETKIDDAKPAEAQVSSGISIPMSMLYIDSATFNKLVEIDPKKPPNCPVPPRNNDRKEKVGNLILKYFIEGNTLNLKGWSYDPKGKSDFQLNSNVQFQVHTLPNSTVFAENGAELGDLIWAYYRMLDIYCQNQTLKKSLIILEPKKIGDQIGWGVYLADALPKSAGDLKSDTKNFLFFQGLEPNPIPPKSINTEWGDN